MVASRIRVSSHAIARYMERTGTVFNGDTAKELKGLVNGGVEITPKEVLLHDFPLTRIVRGDKYILFHATRPIVGVVSKDNMLKTILTKDMLSIPRCYSRKSDDVERKIQEVRERVL